MKKTPPSIIPLSYDYQNMTPSSPKVQAAYSEATTSFIDNQYQSFFGDPVPPTPSKDYLDNLDSSLCGSFRRESYASAIADDFNSTIYLATGCERKSPRLFSQTPITSTGVGLCPSLESNVKTLPESVSAHSSFYSQNFLNYGLLRQDDELRSTNDERQEQRERLNRKEFKKHVQDNQFSRKVTDFSEEFQSNVGSLRERYPDIPDPPPEYNFQISNESCLSSEWFKTINALPEIRKMPKMRPSSKNVLSIKNQEIQLKGSPIADMINDSNRSSSGENQIPTDPAPARPPNPQPDLLRSLKGQASSIDLMFLHKLLPISSPSLPPTVSTTLESELLLATTIRQMSPVIFTEAISTGAENRVTAPRTHNMPSFTIIAQKPPRSSHAQIRHENALGNTLFLYDDPRNYENFHNAESKETSQKPVGKVRVGQNNSDSSMRLTVPSVFNPKSIHLETSQRPFVQFSIIENRNPTKLKHQKGIVQLGTHSATSSQETITSTQIKSLTLEKKVKSCEALPLIKNSLKTAISNLKIPSAASIHDFNSNPTRKQRGLLRVINSADSNSRIPIRSEWTSVEDLPTKQKQILSPIRVHILRRSSSTSPERNSSSQTEPRSSIISDRRSSNLSSLTTSDFSYRRNSLPPARSLFVPKKKLIFPEKTIHSTPTSPSKQLRVSRTPRKIVKPTTLSPILGTPNKDFPHAPTQDDQSISISRKNTLSRIPIINNLYGMSMSNSELSSKGNSRVSSRSSSPRKNTDVSLRVDSSLSQETLITESKQTSKNGSRPISKAEVERTSSRSTSRASTRQASRTTSRASSRPNLLIEDSNVVANRRTSSLFSKRNESLENNSKISLLKSNKSSPRSLTAKKSSSKSKNPAKTSTPNMRIKKSMSSIPTLQKTTTSRQVKKDSLKRKSLVSAKKIYVSSGTEKTLIYPKNKISNDSNKIRRTISLVKKTSIKSSILAQNDSPNVEKNRNLQSKILNKPLTGARREPTFTQQVKVTASKLKREDTSTRLNTEKSKVEQTPSDQNQSKAYEHRTQATGERTKESKQLKREPSNLTLLTIGPKLNLIRKRSDSNLSKKLEDVIINTSKQNGNTRNPNNPEESIPEDGSKYGRVKSLINVNVVSKTTAAITAQPVGISSILNNQLPKINTTGQQVTDQKDISLPAVILEKSQKTLENIQKTVTEASEEIQKTINENLTDLKTFEIGMGKMTEELTRSPLSFEKSDSLKTVIENHNSFNEESIKLKESQSRTIDGEIITRNYEPLAERTIDATLKVNEPSNGEHLATLNGQHFNTSAGVKAYNQTADSLAVDEDLVERVSERAISVLPEVDCDSANLQNSETEPPDELKSASGQPSKTICSQPSLPAMHVNDENKPITDRSSSLKE